MEKNGFNRPIRAMIFVGFALLFTTLFIMGYTAYTSVYKMTGTLERFTKPNKYVESLKKLTDSIMTAEGYVRAYTFSENPAEKEAYEAVMRHIGQSYDSLEESADTLLINHALLEDFNQLFLAKAQLLDSTIRLVEATDSVSLFDTLVNKVSREIYASNQREKDKIPQIHSIETSPRELKPDNNQNHSAENTKDDDSSDNNPKEEKEASGLKKFFQRFSKKKDKKDKNDDNSDIETEITEATEPENTNTDNISENTEGNTSVTNDSNRSNITTGPTKDRLALRKLRREIDKLKAEQEILDQNDRRLQREMREMSDQGAEILIDIMQLVREIELDEIDKYKASADKAKEKFRKTARLVGYFSLVVLLLCAILISIIFNDISRTRKLQAKLKEEKALAESLAKAKEEFLANMSHEIRTPMNAVIGFAEQLAGTKLSEKQSGFLQPIRSSAVYLLNLINDILDASKIDSGHFKLEEIGFLPEEVIDEVQSTFDASAQSKDIGLSCTISQEVPKVLIGDPLRLKQMIFNLVSNAIKFTEEGHVAVHCKLVSRKEESALLAFQVKDTGIGIPEDRLKTIFDEFVQADSSTTRKYGGTGLGLSITKKLAEMHGGYVDMKSEVGKGTEITLYIPYTPGSDKDLEIMAPEGKITFDLLKGKRALVADDEPYNRMLIETIMERWGVEIFVAEDGKKALELIQEGNQFDFILMDLQMPEVDGFEAVRQIREVHNLNLPILALTATATEQEITKTLEIGMNGHLLKPFKERELYALLLNLLNVENKQDIETEIKELEEALSPEKDDLITEEENMATYNFDELYRLANKNKDFMINMLNIFVNNTHKNLSAMVAGMEKEDWEEVSMRAHKIIPPSRHLGLGNIVNQLKSIELDAMNKTNLESLPVAVKKVASEIEETIESIQKDIKNMS